MSRTLAYYILAFFFVPLICHPQSTAEETSGSGSCEVWGQIVGSARLLQEGMDIELLDRGVSKKKNAVKQRVHVLANGNFGFRAVPSGDYQFRVLDNAGDIVLDQVKSITGSSGFVLLIVRDPKSQFVSRDTVSLFALQHKTPKRAWDAFRAAQKARAAGDAQSAIEHLQAALVLDPQFPEAHSDLAAIEAGVGRVDEALDHARSAFRLNPQLPEAGCNFALLLMAGNHYQEAESVARQLLAGQTYLSLLHGVLAISLIEQKKNIDEGLEHLGAATAEYPFFRLLGARALVEIKRPDLALIQVKKYLQTSAHDCERPELEAWVASVERRLAYNTK